MQATEAEVYVQGVRMKVNGYLGIAELPNIKEM